MKLIIPMAGRGSRLRPHTLTVPKPLIKIAGKSILSQLVLDVSKLVEEPIEEMAFVLGDEKFFGDEIVFELKKLAKRYNAKASIYRQLNPLGTGHAIMCAEKSLKGKAMVIYPDTLIKANTSFNKNSDAVSKFRFLLFFASVFIAILYNVFIFLKYKNQKNGKV